MGTCIRNATLVLAPRNGAGKMVALEQNVAKALPSHYRCRRENNTQQSPGKASLVATVKRLMWEFADEARMKCGRRDSREVGSHEVEILEEQVAEVGHRKGVVPVVVWGIPVALLHHQHKPGRRGGGRKIPWGGPRLPVFSVTTPKARSPHRVCTAHKISLWYQINTKNRGLDIEMPNCHS